MDFRFLPITIENVREIDEWHYNGEFEDLYMKPYFTSYENGGLLKGPGGCEGFAAFCEDELAGIFEFTLIGGTMVIGLALHPDFVGKGRGTHFVNQGIQFGLDYYNSTIDVVRLEVDANNKPAIRVYEKAGFERIAESDGEVEMKRSVRG